MKPNTPKRRLIHEAPLLLILLLAVGWRLALWSQPLHEPANDEIEYIRVAYDLLEGRGWVFYEAWRWLRAPLYPLFLAWSLWLAGGNLKLAALPNLVASLIVVYLIYRLTYELAPESSRRAALLAALAAALLQTYATFASLYMSETLFSLLFGGMLLALAVWRRMGEVAWLALAGGLFGLACLTRSAALVLLPALLVWTAVVAGRRHGRRAIVSAVLIALVSAGVVIAPWTIRNCRAYDACILIETGLAYNLWAFYEPHEDLGTINATLEAIPDPATRAAEATRRGLARLREDPTILLRKIPVEWSRLWAVKIIQDRFLLPSYYADPPPPVFLASLMLDDLLYLQILLLAGFGLALGLSRRDELTGLLAAWIALFVAATLLTHAEGRYRHFLFVALLPLAGMGADGLLRRIYPRPRVALAVSVPLVLALLPLISYYPWSWALNGAARSVYRWAGDGLAALGRMEAAEQAYLAALEYDTTPDGWIALGDLRRAWGDQAGAETAYAIAFSVAGPYPAASARRGDLLREQGRDDEARLAFRGRYLDQGKLTEWSYRFLRPRPIDYVDIGDGLDFGYVGHMYVAETAHGANGRWTNGDGRLRLSALDAAPVLLEVRMTAPRPNGEPVASQLCAGRWCAAGFIGSDWRRVRVLLPAGSDEIAVRSPVFRATDGRVLGVFLDWARVRSPSEEQG